MNSSDHKANKQNHDTLAEFIKATEHDENDVTKWFKAVIAQILRNSHRGLSKIAIRQDGYIKESDVLKVQITELRNCIIDLSQVLNRIENNKESVQ